VIRRHGETGFEIVQARIEVVEREEPFGLRKRQRFQQHRVHEREDRRVGADAEGQCQDDDQREPRLVDQTTNRVAHRLSPFA
jgi:hypothetical protein